MELDKMIALIQAVSDSSLTGFVMDEGNLHLELQKMPIFEEKLGSMGERKAAVLQSQDGKIAGTEIALIPEEAVKAESALASQDVKLGSRFLQPSSEEQKPIEPIGTPVCSPLVGTFYCAPSEGEPPFVKVGDRVKKGQVLGIIEAMKLMNEIECEQDGVVVAVLVENEQMVEYGQTLFLIQ